MNDSIAAPVTNETTATPMRKEGEREPCDATDERFLGPRERKREYELYRLAMENFWDGVAPPETLY